MSITFAAGLLEEMANSPLLHHELQCWLFLGRYYDRSPLGRLIFMLKTGEY